MIPKKEAFTTGTRTQAETLAQYPPKARYFPKTVTEKTVETVDGSTKKIPMRPVPSSVRSINNG
jgi:hypothetical protein